LNLIWLIYFVYLLGSLALYFIANPDIDQFGKALVISPLYSFVPFFLIFLAILSLKSYDKKLRRIIDAILISALFAISSCFSVLLLNMYLGPQTEKVLSGIVVDKLPGRGNSKPAIIIDSEGSNIRLGIQPHEWRKAEIGEQFSVYLKQGSLGLYYRGHGDIAGELPGHSINKGSE
jgi:hypothetical protein